MQESRTNNNRTIVFYWTHVCDRKSAFLFFIPSKKRIEKLDFFLKNNTVGIKF